MCFDLVCLFLLTQAAVVSCHRQSGLNNKLGFFSEFSRLKVQDQNAQESWVVLTLEVSFVNEKSHFCRFDFHALIALSLNTYKYSYVLEVGFNIYIKFC